MLGSEICASNIWPAIHICDLIQAQIRSPFLLEDIYYFWRNILQKVTKSIKNCLHHIVYDDVAF